MKFGEAFGEAASHRVDRYPELAGDFVVGEVVDVEHVDGVPAGRLQLF